MELCENRVNLRCKPKIFCYFMPMSANKIATRNICSLKILGYYLRSLRLNRHNKVDSFCSKSRAVPIATC